ncbi:hypothetical protein KP509_19G064200 [Ceratopteris richardii]|nr:hypothetical protein KP509_19G064200 [Ceratopteris richardii]
MSAYIQNGKACEVLFIFHQSQQEGFLPDKVTFLNALTAHSGRQECRGECKRLHVRVLYGGFISDDAMVTALICAYGRCSHLYLADKCFQVMEKRSLVTWNAMITLYAQEGHFDAALAIFHQMQVEGVAPDSVTFIALLEGCSRQRDIVHGKQIHLIIQSCSFKFDVVLNSSIINLYRRCGNIDDAHSLFIKMKDRNVVSWNIMIGTFAHHGFGTDALLFFRKMQHEAITPNKVTFLEVLSAIACQTDLAIGKKVHSCLLQTPICKDDEVRCSLINMYGKCGNAMIARGIFDSLHTHKKSTWNSMITIYALLGEAKEAIQMLENMKLDGIYADDITFTSVLVACSRNGMLDEGSHYFVCMSTEYGLAHTEEHFDCMIDLFCRAGLFDHAVFVLRNMPNGPTTISWTSLFCTYGVVFQGVSCNLASIFCSVL